MQLATIPYEVNVAAIGGMSAIAIWRGGRDERLMAVIQFVCEINSLTHLRGATLLFGKASGVYPLHDQIVPTIPFDVLEFVVCFALALYSRRYWTLWASSILLLALLTDAMIVGLPKLVDFWAYGSASLVWNYTTSMLVLWGALSRPPSGEPVGRQAPAA